MTFFFPVKERSSCSERTRYLVLSLASGDWGLCYVRSTLCFALASIRKFLALRLSFLVKWSRDPSLEMQITSSRVRMSGLIMTWVYEDLLGETSFWMSRSLEQQDRGWPIAF